MNIPSAKDYSIWLMFERNIELQLQLIIDTLSMKFNSTVFLPHLTLVSGIKKDENLLSNTIHEIFKGLEPFEINITELEFSDDFYKSVYFEVQSDEFLQKLFTDAIKLLEIEPEKPFQPHISLVYSYDSKTNEAIITKEIKKFLLKKILVDKLALVKTQGIPSEWQTILTLHL